MFRLATQDNWPLQKIGEVLGHISKQEVSRCIHRLRIMPLNSRRVSRPGIKFLIKACDESASATCAAAKLHIGVELLKNMLREVGFLKTYEEKWIEKRGKLHRRRLCKILRVIAKQYGHTPSISEVNFLACSSNGRIPYHNAWARAFGSFRKGQTAANLEPNDRGGKSAQIYTKAS